MVQHVERMRILASQMVEHQPIFFFLENDVPRVHHRYPFRAKAVRVGAAGVIELSIRNPAILQRGLRAMGIGEFDSILSETIDQNRVVGRGAQEILAPLVRDVFAFAAIGQKRAPERAHINIQFVFVLVTDSGGAGIKKTSASRLPTNRCASPRVRPMGT